MNKLLIVLLFSKPLISGAPIHGGIINAKRINPLSKDTIYLPHHILLPGLQYAKEAEEYSDSMVFWKNDFFEFDLSVKTGWPGNYYLHYEIPIGLSFFDATMIIDSIQLEYIEPKLFHFKFRVEDPGDVSGILQGGIYIYYGHAPGDKQFGATVSRAILLLRTPLLAVSKRQITNNPYTIRYENDGVVVHNSSLEDMFIRIYSSLGNNYFVSSSPLLINGMYLISINTIPKPLIIRLTTKTKVFTQVLF